MPISAEAVLDIIKSLNLPERKRLAELLEGAAPDPFREVGYVVIPEAVGGMLVDVMGKMTKLAGEQGRKMIELGRRLKRHKSSPGIIRRNVEICDLRKQDARKWSQGRLAKKYHVTTRVIRKVLKDEEKWRKLAEQIGPI